MKLTEGNLEFTFKGVRDAVKFDGSSHGLTSVMSAVDFVVELERAYLFVEVKDPDNPRATDEGRDKFSDKLSSEELLWGLVEKYRESFLYRWAQKRIDKPITYVVLLCAQRLDPILLLGQQDKLREYLPLTRPDCWARGIADGCAILTLEQWKKKFPDFAVVRLKQSKAD